MDEADEMQIINDLAAEQALVYEAQGKKSLSFVGIKFLFQKWTDAKEATVEIVEDHTFCRLEKDVEDDKNHWYWRAEFTLRTRRELENGKTQTVETKGSQEQAYCQNGQYDKFGKTKAFSKAERNADRKQIPEFEITNMINQIKPEHVQDLNSRQQQHTTPAPVAQHYLQTLKSLGYTGPEPKTSFEASKKIEELKQNSRQAEITATDEQKKKLADLGYDGDIPQTKEEAERLLDKLKDSIVHGGMAQDSDNNDYEKYCIGKVGDVTHNFTPNDKTNGRTCRFCNKLAPAESAPDKIEYCMCSEKKPKFEKNDAGLHVCYGCSKPVEPEVAKKLLGGSTA